MRFYTIFNYKFALGLNFLPKSLSVSDFMPTFVNAYISKMLKQISWNGAAGSSLGSYPKGRGFESFFHNVEGWHN